AAPAAPLPAPSAAPARKTARHSAAATSARCARWHVAGVAAVVHAPVPAARPRHCLLWRPVVEQGRGRMGAVLAPQAQWAWEPGQLPERLPVKPPRPPVPLRLQVPGALLEPAPAPACVPVLRWLRFR